MIGAFYYCFKRGAIKKRLFLFAASATGFGAILSIILKVAGRLFCLVALSFAKDRSFAITPQLIEVLCSRNIYLVTLTCISAITGGAGWHIGFVVTIMFLQEDCS